MTPLIFTGLSVSVALSIGAWNIGAEGQFYAGAFAATGVGLYWHAPAPLMLPLMFVAGALGGAAWILAPTLARAYAGVSELITTLLLNFVALLLVYGVATAPWLDPGGHALGTTAYRGDVDLGGDRGAVRPLADAARLRDGGDRRQGLFRHAGAGGVRPGPIPYLKDLPILMHFLLFRRRLGLDIRAVGENPAAADATGVPVTRLRFWCVSLGVALAAGAGAYLTLAFVPSWSEGVVAGRGWIAVSLVIFAGYRPINAVLAALLFGLITSLGFVGQARNWPFAPTILSMLPYLGAIAFIILPALASGKLRRLMAAPAALGEPYFRDQR